MPRPYNLSPKGKAALVKTAEHAREVRASRDPVEILARRIKHAKANLSATEWDRLRALLASAPMAAKNEDF
ncbi:hypothetical protein ACIRU8_02945 [Streptomyces sp. NPDC101175]|uniref:hypothetical protein n=1 Tax=Streptomyces sp. NPDC101175 TaxID=3366123 RepID=UPI003837BF7A